MQGLVKVNGRVAILGQKADPEVDSVEVDGKVIQARKEMLYYLMNKPRGVVTTNLEGDRGNRGNKRNKELQSSITSVPSHSFIAPPSVRDLLPPHLRGKIFPVGRLDKESEGLLLLTNDGVLAYRLMHPKFDHEKEYEVAVECPVMEGALMKMRRGMMISGERTKPALVRKTGLKTFVIALTEGRNRQIRRMCQKVGNPVVRLKRVRIMGLRDARLAPGAVRPLSASERAQLLAAIGI
jgi:pseudouridine synthase